MHNSFVIFLQIIARPVVTHFRFLFFSYLLFAFCILVCDECLYPPFYIKLFFELFFDLYVVCTILAAFPLKVSAFLKGVLIIVSSLCALIDVFCAVKLDTTITPSVVQLILETNPKEAGNFASAYINMQLLASSAGFVFFLLIMYGASFFIRFKMKGNTCFLGLATLLGVLLGLYCSFPNKAYVKEVLSLKSVDAIEGYLGTHNWAIRAFYSPVHRLLFSLRCNYLAQHQLENLVILYNDLKIDPSPQTSPYIVLIIGESFNKHHSQLYGYPLLTTPRQQEMKDNGELFVFTDAVSPYNLTSDVFKNMFSTNDLSRHQSWMSFPLFTQIFHKAGYNVCFITNQYVPKQDKEFFDFSGGVFLNHKDISATQFSHRNTAMYDSDIELLADYDSLSRFNGTRNLIVFHLMGQHFDYRNRFPSDSVCFHVSDYNRNDLSADEKQIVADYDNATRYNDFIVAEIVRRFADKNAVALYLSDHGEEVYDDLRVSGRIHGQITQEMAKNEFQIPFWVWCSKQFAENNKDLMQQIASAVDKPFFSDDLSHVLIGLGGIKCKYYNPQLDILNPQYDIKRKRLLRGSIDYQSIMK